MILRLGADIKRIPPMMTSPNYTYCACFSRPNELIGGAITAAAGSSITLVVRVDGANAA